MSRQVERFALGDGSGAEVVYASDYDTLYRKERHYLNRCAALEVERGELREFADTLEAERDALRAEVERLRTHLRVTEDDLAATRERCEDALAAAAELEVERDEATAALTELAPLAPILEERRRIAAAIRSNCAASGHVSPARAFLGDPCCAICEASARIAEEDA